MSTLPSARTVARILIAKRGGRSAAETAKTLGLDEGLVAAVWACLRRPGEAASDPSPLDALVQSICHQMRAAKRDYVEPAAPTLAKVQGTGDLQVVPAKRVVRRPVRRRFNNLNNRRRGRPPLGRQVTIVLPADDLAAVDARAKAEGVPRSEMIRRLLGLVLEGAAA